MFRAFLLLFMLILHANQPAAALERSKAQGISSRAILGFVDAAEDSIDALHTLHAAARRESGGRRLVVPLQPRHRLYSLSKSFTSIAVGLAVEEGLMSLDPGPRPLEEAPAEPDENLAAIGAGSAAHERSPERAGRRLLVDREGHLG